MKKKLFYDCEFIEGTQKKLFGKTKPTIDLISIGMVDENGNEFYAISKEFNLKEAWNRYDRAPQTIYEKQNGFAGRRIYWIRDNVLRPIYDYLFQRIVEDDIMLTGDEFVTFNYTNFKALIKRCGKTIKEISYDIRSFVCSYETASYWADIDSIDLGWNEYMKANPIELYGYYSSYDHVALCWIFGKMIELPSGFPMYTIDLKQMIDSLPIQLDELKSNTDYPPQENEHGALDDARWNKKLYDFIKIIS